ncbi:trans-aconitate 2-methyltransferase [Saccharothrix violaceirubra]|uniref:Trans-aconitate 2-methyltransferase n=1 Tax=Saccharothrix violaceirubra TaxID=413306 RepID=A0A7W7T777_9PSEU|nr:trans-aconitate 2-methyltransferase [Saccharothrix violaceirubra]MBB4967839.1 trans-aconitate 2-methyltransferase [Saccharothrix violaceirubra]
MWDPTRYLDFADDRARPFHDLVNRIGAEDPRRVVDVGCGPGHLTEVLALRWPKAVIEAFDSSPEMVESARGRGLAATVGDVRTWQPEPDTDVVVTNAVLQWVPGHEDLLRRWLRALPSGAWLAMQVPGNFADPTHRLVHEVVGESWPALRGLLREAPVLDPLGYARVLGGASVDAWETTYLHVLTGDDPVLEWITGTLLRPIRAALTDEAWQAFRDELAPRLRTAYPPDDDGVTHLPFRRVFAVARVA